MIASIVEQKLATFNSAAALKHGTRKRKRKRKRKLNTESNINEREFGLVFFAVPLNTLLLLCLDKVCRSVGYCTARPIKVILLLIFIHEFMG